MALKLVDLDQPYWRAECARVALFIAKIDFEDQRVGPKEIFSLGALTFGTFPALVVEGKGILNQTQAGSFHTLLFIKPLHNSCPIS